MTTELIKKAKIHCQSLIENSRCKGMQFHNWQHTKEVVRYAILIAKHEKLSKNTIEEIIIASYFHDTGNEQTEPGHEQRSCEYAKAFLSQNKFPEERITTVTKIIKATKMPQRPKTLVQKVICDADLAHLGKKNFGVKNNSLRNEWEDYGDMYFTNEKWCILNISFLKNHRFQTGFAQKYYSEQKLENIKTLKALLPQQEP